MPLQSSYERLLVPTIQGSLDEVCYELDDTLLIDYCGACIVKGNAFPHKMTFS